VRLTLKVCCIANVAEARVALDLGVNAFGLVSHMPSGPGVIAETQIAEVAEWLPVGVASVLLTSETNARRSSASSGGAE
jgi:phosphoribosylanthranilate isomerase